MLAVIFSLLIVGCFCLVKLLSAVNPPLRMSHPLFPRQALAALVSTASIHSNRGRANPSRLEEQKKSPLAEVTNCIFSCHTFLVLGIRTFFLSFFGQKLIEVDRPLRMKKTKRLCAHALLIFSLVYKLTNAC